jgi:hypothetical protein
MKLENVLFILTVPAEYNDKAIRTMRECMHDAGLIGDDLYSERLQFTTERMYFYNLMSDISLIYHVNDIL